MHHPDTHPLIYYPYIIIICHICIHKKIENKINGVRLPMMSSTPTY